MLESIILTSDSRNDTRHYIRTMGPRSRRSSLLRLHNAITLSPKQMINSPTSSGNENILSITIWPVNTRSDLIFILRSVQWSAYVCFQWIRNVTSWINFKMNFAIKKAEFSYIFFNEISESYRHILKIRHTKIMFKCMKLNKLQISCM